jgi:hypothetical protein
MHIFDSSYDTIKISSLKFLLMCDFLFNENGTQRVEISSRKVLHYEQKVNRRKHQSEFFSGFWKNLLTFK